MMVILVVPLLERKEKNKVLVNIVAVRHCVYCHDDFLWMFSHMHWAPFTKLGCEVKLWSSLWLIQDSSGPM
jgi:hypothetical protein